MNNKIELNFWNKTAVFFLPDTFDEAEYLDVMRKLLRNCWFSYEKSLSLTFNNCGKTKESERSSHP